MAMNMRGQAKQLKAINVMLDDAGPEYRARLLEMNAPKVPVPAGQSAKSSMVDGPYGGKVKA